MRREASILLVKISNGEFQISDLKYGIADSGWIKIAIQAGMNKMAANEHRNQNGGSRHDGVDV
jgi:hypothetical protein